MLIVPLHRSLNRANFPWMTAALILLNGFVFFGLQSRDAAAFARAFEQYHASGLDRIEFPAFLHWLDEHDADENLRETMRESDEEESGELKLRLLQNDEEFVDALEAGHILTPAQEGYAQWREKRDEFDRLWSKSVTERYMQRFSRIEPARMFGSMFLHGGLGHLIGNMIFLALLGLLVEGALGPWLFLALYLLGGLGGQVVSLAWHWGEHGAALGASGAIASLMGAYCVLWGLRKVRVFYWFFVVFDYVRVPAIALLPFWVGWQVFNLLVNRHAHIGFDAHAGGMVCGALLAFGVRKLGWEREDFLAEDERAEQRQHNVSRFEQAMMHLGRLEVAQARRLLEEIDAQEPGRLDVAIALYRCARYGSDAAALDRAVARVLSLGARTREALGDAGPVWNDYLRACDGAPRLPAGALMGFAQGCLRLDAGDLAESALRALAVRAPLSAGIEAAWFVLALRAAENSPSRRERLEFIQRHFPQSAYAAKARFLLRETVE